jgi:hypothetical protein
MPPQQHAQNDISARPQGVRRPRATLEVIFSMLSALFGRVGNKRRIELLHLAAAALRAGHLIGFMLLQG